MLGDAGGGRSLMTLDGQEDKSRVWEMRSGTELLGPGPPGGQPSTANSCREAEQTRRGRGAPGGCEGADKGRFLQPRAVDTGLPQGCCLGVLLGRPACVWTA